MLLGTVYYEIYYCNCIPKTKLHRYIKEMYLFLDCNISWLQSFNAVEFFKNKIVKIPFQSQWFDVTSIIIALPGIYECCYDTFLITMV